MGSPSSRRAPVLRSSSCAIPFAVAASLLLLSGLVGAVDILLCPQNNCGGTCLGCWNVAKHICCVPPPAPSPVNPANSIDIQNANVPDVPATSKFYITGGCSGVPSRGGNGDVCQPQIWQGFTGTLWFTEMPPPATNRRLQSADVSETIPLAGTMEANAAFFTENGMKGKWVLPLANVTDVFSQVNDLSDADTLNWFKSQGAFYSEP